MDHHTFKFTKKAESEGMPVIDDSNSILRCTNKAFLAGILAGEPLFVARYFMTPDHRQILKHGSDGQH